MASTSQRTLMTTFAQVSWSQPSGRSGSSDQGLIDALVQASQVTNSQAQATAANTEALAQNSQAKSSGGSGAVSDVLGNVSQILGGGLSLMPIVSLFTSLFGGGKSEQPAPLEPFTLPPSLNLESTTNNQNVGWGENGLPRSAGGGSSPAQQITVQVQAMDSQSFLDHSEDIAQAVRRAMLNMSSINDVITNL